MDRVYGGGRELEGEKSVRPAPWADIQPNRSRVSGAAWRETLIKEVADSDIRIRYRRSEPPPPFSYAVTLEVVDDGTWTTVRLWDNADAPDEHHEHAYTRSGGKQAPRILAFDSPNQAIAAAIAEAKRRAEVIVRQWRES